MKKFFLTFLLLIGMSIGVKAIPACITNIVISYTVPGGNISVDGTSLTNIIFDRSGAIECDGPALIADSCTDGPAVNISFPCQSGGSAVAIVSWACTPTCGDGGSFTVKIPANCDSVSFRIFECGQCCLSYCIIDSHGCKNPSNPPLLPHVPIPEEEIDAE